MRAQVLAALGACERERWVDLTHTSDLAEYPELLRALEAAALVARVPRQAVRQYAAISLTAWWLSKDEAELIGSEGGIPSPVAQAARDSATLLADLIWNPWRGRIRLGPRIDAINDEVNAYDDQDVQRRLKMARERSQ